MRYLFVISGLLFCMFSAAQQKKYKLYVSVTPSVTFDTKFENGRTVLRSVTNKTGDNYLYPLFSLLWGSPNPQYTFLQNFARKFNIALLGEAMLNDDFSINTGFEIGARGYKILSDASVSSLVSYRNLSVPLHFSHYRWLGKYWTLKEVFGGSFNLAYSIPNSNKVIEINRHPYFYPLLGGGIEFAYLGKEGKLAFEINYYKGFQNIIDHTYVGLDNRYGEKITATGTVLRMGVKYNFFSFDLKKKKKKERKPEPEMPAFTGEQDFINRELLPPVEMTVDGDAFQLCVTDDQTVDGDSIVVMFNGRIISQAIGLTKKEVCLPIRLQENGPNILAVHALNEGKIRPNTYEITIVEGTKRQSLRLKSNMTSSGTLVFRKR